MNRLDEIEARTNAATEGPWRASVVATYVDADGRRRGKGGIYPGGEPGPPPLFLTMDWLATDAEFIAHARTDVPALVEALRAVLNLHFKAQPIPAAFGTQEGGDYCVTCAEDWPCPTVETIRQHIGDDL